MHYKKKLTNWVSQRQQLISVTFVHLQKDDGKMVWQKRGFVDLVQVRGLEILAGVAGVAICAHFLMMIFPKRD